MISVSNQNPSTPSCARLEQIVLYPAIHANWTSVILLSSAKNKQLASVIPDGSMIISYFLSSDPGTESFVIDVSTSRI